MERDAPATPPITRTERGLVIAGTRITLYNIMDCILAGWPPQRIRRWYDLTDQQVHDALAYVEAHRAEVEAEYQQVLQEAEEIRQYWEERNRERLAKIAALPSPPGKEHIHAKLQAWKAKLDAAR